MHLTLPTTAGATCRKGTWKAMQFACSMIQECKVQNKVRAKAYVFKNLLWSMPLTLSSPRGGPRGPPPYGPLPGPPPPGPPSHFLLDPELLLYASDFSI